MNRRILTSNGNKQNAFYADFYFICTINDGNKVLVNLNQLQGTSDILTLPLFHR
jgi:hypothetical protein